MFCQQWTSSLDAKGTVVLYCIVVSSFVDMAMTPIKRAILGFHVTS